MGGPTITDWIGAASAALSTLAVIVGLAYGHIQLNRWKDEARRKRRSELAEQLWAEFCAARDFLRETRSPLSYVPLDQSNNKAYVYEERLKKIGSETGLFRSLRTLQIRAEVVFDSTSIDEAIQVAFSTRMDLAVALQEMIEIVDDQDSVRRPETPDRLGELRRDIFSSGGERDKLGAALDAAVETLRNELKPHIAFQ